MASRPWPRKPSSARAQGFRHIKLHEERLETATAARMAAGKSTWLALDTNSRACSKPARSTSANPA
jgi:L-alanine-DL-glutamate epimerase-like enolase superfamily enzyme